MNFIAYLKKYTTLPKDFVNDYVKIFYSDEENDIERITIDFNSVVDWLGISSKSLKNNLRKNFKENVDYEIKSDSIQLTPNTVKHIAMICRTKKANTVRLYYLEMERLLYKYYNYIEELYGTKNNKKNAKIEGYVYILEALRDNLHVGTDNENVNQYIKENPININRQNKTYKSTNHINPIFITETSDIMSVEKCINKMTKKYSHYIHDDIYVIDVYLLKNIISECDVLIDKSKSRNTYIGKLAKTEIDGYRRKFYIKIIKKL